MVKSHLQLNDADRSTLRMLVNKSSLSVKVYKRATALLKLDQGSTLESVAALLTVNYNTVAVWRDAYQKEGLAMLHDKPRSGRPVQIDGVQRAQITALACSTPPEGSGRWSVNLLANKVVELGYVESISRSRVAVILKKTNSSRI
jgi:putative transposase